MSWHTIGYECKIDVKFVNGLELEATGSTQSNGVNGPGLARCDATEKLIVAAKEYGIDCLSRNDEDGTLSIDPHCAHEIRFREYAMKVPTGHEGPITVDFEKLNLSCSEAEKAFPGMQAEHAVWKPAGYESQIYVQFMDDVVINVLGGTNDVSSEGPLVAYRETMSQFVREIKSSGLDCITTTPKGGVAFTKNNIQAIRYIPAYSTCVLTPN